MNNLYFTDETNCIKNTILSALNNISNAENFIIESRYDNKSKGKYKNEIDIAYESLLEASVRLDCLREGFESVPIYS